MTSLLKLFSCNNSLICLKYLEICSFSTLLHCSIYSLDTHKQCVFRRETGDKVEKEGVARAISRSGLCDLLIIMVDISEDNSSDSILILISQQVHQLLDQHFQASLNFFIGCFLSI